MAFRQRYTRRRVLSASFLRERRRKDHEPTLEKVSEVSGKRVSSTHIVQAAIDFGTTYSGIAFSFKHDYEENPLKIHANEWKNVAQGQMNVKTPSCLLLKGDKSLHSFGHQAITAYNGLILDGEHESYYFFWQFKMVIHQTKEITPDYKLKDENGKELSAVKVFSMSIKFLKDHLMTNLKNAMPSIKDDDIGWVITVPAIWNDTAKKFMRLAAKKAGISNGSLEIALEPEAASLYCRLLPVTKDPQIEKGVTKFPVGSTYMVLDCVGGTVDVTIHEVLEGNNLRELHKATGGGWGGNVVNKRFMSFIEELVGKTVFQQFLRDHRGDYLELLSDFETKKRQSSPSDSETVTIRLPTALQDVFKTDCSKSANKEKGINKYGSKVKVVGDKLRIEAGQFRSLFEDAIRDIVAHVGDLYESLPFDLKAILMVGGFSESPVLQKAIRDHFKNKTCEVIIPQDASLCVLKGAVLYGHDPSKITERKARFTFGVAMAMPFDKSSHPEAKKIMIDGEEMCNDLFDKHVTVGDTLKAGEAQSKRTYFPLSEKDSTYPVVVFASSKKDPMFVDEKECKCLGYFLAKRRSDANKSVDVKLHFGDADIHVEVVNDDGTSETADFKF